MPTEADLIHLVYASVATKPLERDELLALLTVVRRINESLGVTGILLYVDGTFFQVLEGSSADVTALYDKIHGDRRHTRVLKLIQEPIAARDFPDWSMGYAAVSRADLETIPGLTDFFGSKTSFMDLQEGRARRLLEAFSQGRWRANVLP